MKKILIIEDQKNIIEILKFALDGANAEIFNEKDGSNAISKVMEVKPDLILLDLMLPGKSGFEILEEIRESSVIANIPIIVMSAKFEEKVINKAKALGADDYLTKPFDIDNLLALVKKFIP